MNEIKLGDEVLVRCKGKVVKMELEGKITRMQVKSDGGNYMFVDATDLTVINNEVGYAVTSTG